MPSGVHLLVVCHGLWGSVQHVDSICEIARAAGSNPDQPRSKRRSSKVDAEELELVVLAASQWQSVMTYDGIDTCAEKVAKEIDETIEALEKEGKSVVAFSMVGYSLGGLVARYTLGLLHSRTPSFFDTVAPLNFSTFASPAIGIPPYAQVWPSVTRFFGRRILSRSGRQMYGDDKFLPAAFRESDVKQKKGQAKAEPLLKVMADPRFSFYQALLRFEKIDVYANAVKDLTVPYPTGAISAHDPFASATSKAHRAMAKRDVDHDEVDTDLREGGLELEMDPDFPVVIKDFKEIEPIVVAGTEVAVKRRYRIKLPGLLRPSRYPWSRPVSTFVVILLPVALPVLLTTLIASLALQSLKSGLRIKEIRKQLEGGRSGALARVGLRVDEAVMSLVADLQDDNPEQALEAGMETPKESASSSLADIKTSPLRPKAPTDPNLSDDQLEMIRHLNSIPHLKKHLVYLPKLRNAHGTIIARDQKFEDHKKYGLQVLRNWSKDFLV